MKTQRRKINNRKRKSLKTRKRKSLKTRKQKKGGVITFSRNVRYGNTN